MAGDWSDADVVHHHAESGAVFYARCPGCCASCVPTGASRPLGRNASNSMVLRRENTKLWNVLECVALVCVRWNVIDAMYGGFEGARARYTRERADVIASSRCAKLIRWPGMRISWCLKDTRRIGAKANTSLFGIPRFFWNVILGRNRVTLSTTSAFDISGSNGK